MMELLREKDWDNEREPLTTLAQRNRRSAPGKPLFPKVRLGPPVFPQF
jgi:hypothetical protein